MTMTADSPLRLSRTLRCAGAHCDATVVRVAGGGVHAKLMLERACCLENDRGEAVFSVLQTCMRTMHACGLMRQLSRQKLSQSDRS
jgi:hypothetical protein